MAFEITMRNVPGTKNSITLDEGSTLKDLEANIGSFEGKQVRVNGATVKTDAPLKSGDSVVASRAPRGA